MEVGTRVYRLSNLDVSYFFVMQCESGTDWMITDGSSIFRIPKEDVELSKKNAYLKVINKTEATLKSAEANVDRIRTALSKLETELKAES